MNLKVKLTLDAVGYIERQQSAETNKEVQLLKQKHEQTNAELIRKRVELA